jgi:hypothetical protein
LLKIALFVTKPCHGLLEDGHGVPHPTARQAHARQHHSGTDKMPFLLTNRFLFGTKHATCINKKTFFEHFLHFYLFFYIELFIFAPDFV